MANEIRLRRNNISGTITDNPLLIGATTINSPGFVDLPTVDTTNHLLLILDPTETNGAAEIVRVTAHTAASSTVTVVRGAETTTPRQHALGVTWHHGPVTTDYAETLTSSTRPTTPHTGELIYETDTARYSSYDGSAWQRQDARGVLGYAEITASQAGVTAVADITGLALTITYPANRRIKISGGGGVGATVATDVVRIAIKEGAGLLQVGDVVPGITSATTGNIWLLPHRIIVPSAGVHTYKLTLERLAGAGTVQISANGQFPAYILIEDMGSSL